jgi:hypothetical protein
MIRNYAERYMPRPTLSDPVNRWTIQARLNASDEQWAALEPHLEHFEGPHGLTLYDWPRVIAAVRRLVAPKRARGRMLRRSTA